MEIDITQFITTEYPMDYSASVMEIGEHAGKYTWAAAKESTSDYLFITDNNKEDYQEYLSHFGAWTNEEMDDWTLGDFTALLIQFISGDMREYSDAPIDDWDWADYEQQSREGQIAGNLFKSKDKYFYSISE